MADHSFSSETVEEFYNSFHDRSTGRFTFKKGGKRGKIHVPMSDAARSSNAILRRLASDRKSKDYKTAKARIHDTWANREKGQGGLRGVKGHGSKKADAARALNAVKAGKSIRLKSVNNKAATESALRAKEQLASLAKARK